MEKFIIESQMFGDFKHAEWKQTLSQTNAGVVLCVVCFNSRPASLTIWHRESSKSGGISDQFSLGSNKRLPFFLEFTSIFPGSTPVVFPNLSMSRHYLQILHSVWAVHTGMLSSQQGSQCEPHILCSFPSLPDHLGSHCCFQVLCCSLRFCCLYPRPSESYSDLICALLSISHQCAFLWNFPF